MWKQSCVLSEELATCDLFKVQIILFKLSRKQNGERIHIHRFNVTWTLLSPRGLLKIAMHTFFFNSIIIFYVQFLETINT